MSSIKLFKKEINNTIGAFIEQVYEWELRHPEADLKSSEKLVDKAIALFDDLIQKIHEEKRKEGKTTFGPLRESLQKSLVGLEKELGKLA